MHHTPLRRSRQLFAAFGLVALVATGAACSSDSEGADDTTTTTTEAAGQDTTPKESEAAIRFVKAIQQELADVGCHPGAGGGVFGPKAGAAILQFQAADGLANVNQDFLGINGKASAYAIGHLACGTSIVNGSGSGNSGVPAKASSFGYAAAV